MKPILPVEHIGDEEPHVFLRLLLVEILKV
jgi:hypothetical protein